ncbi:hypothetical protein JR316_0012590 [Psilocybe cubensis]|uniref:Uncharacterized protein n=2 Tax=Psilocybe cubensis TaxID=181762 RepID=A0A8H7XQ01_PSICU|nr:hypothetical protein JR316_0012590 [Psilocybe cubensis]KAH9475479.1 hypothetical protein JR316_0012590 [Psilocybe cubensis]
MTPANHASLFESHPSGIQHTLAGRRMFPHLTTLKLRIKQTMRGFSGFITQINEMLSITPALEHLCIDNGFPLHIAPIPDVGKFPLRYNHLSRLRSITLSTFVPIKQIALFEGLFANDPPPSLTEINIETTINWAMRPANGNIPSTAALYVRGVQLYRLDTFLLRPSFEKVKKLVLRIQTTHQMQFAESDKTVEAIRWRDAMASAVPHLLGKKDLEVEFQLDFNRW